MTANLEPVDSKKVIVRFDYFKLGGLVRIFTLMCLVSDYCMVETGSMLALLASFNIQLTKSFV